MRSQFLAVVIFLVSGTASADLLHKRGFAPSKCYRELAMLETSKTGTRLVIYPYTEAEISNKALNKNSIKNDFGQFEFEVYKSGRPDGALVSIKRYTPVPLAEWTGKINAALKTSRLTEIDCK